MLVRKSFKKWKTRLFFIPLVFGLIFPFSVSAKDRKPSWVEVMEAYENGSAVVEMQPLHMMLSGENFIISSFTLGNTIYVPIRDLGRILDFQVVYDGQTRTASVVKADVKLELESDKNPTYGEKTVYLNKKITAVYQNIEFGRSDSPVLDVVPGFLCEGRLFVRLGTVTQLLGYIRNNQGDKVTLEQESHMLRNQSPRDFGWIMDNGWEKMENSGSFVSIPLTEEAMAIERGYISDGPQVITQQKAEVYRNKETGVLRIFVYTDGYLWTAEQEFNIGAFYDVLDSPSIEGSLFGVMGGKY